MIDFIRADFYRLIHSKGFWITEFALFCVISLGTLFQSNIRFGVNISNHETATQTLGKLTGLQALNYFAGNTDSLIFSPSLSSVWSLEWTYHESSTRTASATASLNSAIIF